MTLWWYFKSWTFKSRCQIKPLVTIPTHETCLFFDSKLLFSMTLWWYFMSCHLKSICQMNLLLRSQHMNPVCSLIQSYSAIWLCCDSSCPAIVQMWNWTSCYNPNRWILFTLWFKITLQYYIVVILQVLHFQVQMWNWISCYNPNTRILFTVWFKITFQYDIVVILTSCTFKSWCEIEPLVTIQTDKSCLLFDSKLLFSMTLWCWFMSWTFKSRCQIKPLVTIPTHESCSLFDSKLLCSMTLWWYFKSCTFKSTC